MGLMIQIRDLMLPTFTMNDKRTSTTRRQFDLQSNETVSTLDTVFENHRQQVQLLSASQLTIPKIVEASKKAIGDHFEQRLQTAFQQCIACYGTGFTFEAGHVEDQGPSARKLSGIPFNAAHVGTVPCLYATDRTGQQFFLFKESDMYLRSNSTDELVKTANNGDIAIDGSNGDQTKARGALLEILNQLANRTLSPKDALIQFRDKLEETVDQALLSSTVSADTKLVLDIYKENLVQINQKLTADPDKFFDALLGVKADANLSDRARQCIYKQRYRVIQEHYAIQSGVRKKIADVQKQIIGADRRPDHFDHVFKGALLKACGESQSSVLTRIFCLPKVVFEQTLPRSNSAQQKIHANQALIDSLARDLIPLCTDLKQSESFYQRNLLIQLRGCLGYSQQRLAAIFKRTFPGTVMSQSTLCRTERGARAVTNELWNRMATLLGIDPVNFFPLVTPLE